MKNKASLLLLTLFLLSTQNCVDEHSIIVEENLSTGKIIINSNPQGAKIFLQGSDTKKFTPDSLTQLENGDYEILLKNDDYVDTTFMTAVYQNVTTTKYISLKPQEFYGKIILESKPSNATIYLNNTFIDKVTKDSLTNLKYGLYNIELKLPTYEDTSVTISLGKNEKITTNIELKKYIPLGEISINSNPPNAIIKFNNILTNYSTPAVLKNLYAGNYTITLSLKDYADTTIFVELAKNEKIATLIALRELPQSGNLSISSDPEGASIYLQGKNTSFFTPHTFNKVEIGPYLVTVKLDDFKDSSFIATVLKDQENEFYTFLVDTVPNVKAEIKYELPSDNETKFMVGFNQSVTLSEIKVTQPKSTFNRTYKFNDRQFGNDILAELIYSSSRTGTWSLQITGKKMRGRKNNFTLNETISVQ